MPNAWTTLPSLVKAVNRLPLVISYLTNHDEIRIVEFIDADNGLVEKVHRD